jgi:hypothetical protein
MNPKVVAKTSEKMPVWQSPGKTAPLLQRLKTATQELQNLQSELCGALAHEDGSAKKQFGELLLCEDLKALKATVDQLRRILWFYFENPVVFENSAPDSANAPNLQQATKPMHKLIPQQAEHIAQPGSFFDRLNLVIEGYMQHSGVSGVRPRRKP